MTGLLSVLRQVRTLACGRIADAHGPAKGPLWPWDLAPLFALKGRVRALGTMPRANRAQRLRFSVGRKALRRPVGRGFQRDLDSGQKGGGRNRLADVQVGSGG